MQAMDIASAILFAAASVVGLSSLLCVRRMIGAGGTPARLVWSGRALALLGAAVAIAFPGVLYRELVDIALPRGADVAWMRTGIAQTALLMPLTVIPALVALRHSLLGGSLFALNAIVSAVLVAYDPFGAFPYRDVPGGLVFDVGPRLLTAALLLGGAVSRRHPKPLTTGAIST